MDISELDNDKGMDLKSKDGHKYEIPLEGSLGLLALGYVGLMAWREKKIETFQKENQMLHNKSDGTSPTAGL